MLGIKNIVFAPSNNLSIEANKKASMFMSYTKFVDLYY